LAARVRFAFLIALLLAPAASRAQTEELAGYLPVVGSLFGDFGSHFETTVQLFNPNPNGMSGRLVFHPAGQLGVDRSLPFHMPFHGTISFEGVVAAMGTSGLGTMDVLWDGKDLKPVVVATVFNEVGSDQLGNQETHGCNEDFVTFVPGGTGVQVTGVLLGPIDVERFRFNVGIRVLGPNPISLLIDVEDPQGNLVHTVTRTYPAGTFQQQSVTDFLDGFEIGNNFSLLMRTGGPVILYGATVDNRTNSPSLQIMPYVSVSP